MQRSLWILLYGCTTCKLIKGMEKKLDGNYRRMLRGILNKSLRPPTSHHENYQSLDESDMQDTAGEAGTSSQVMYCNGPPHIAEQDDQLEPTYSSFVGIRDVAMKTCQKQSTIGRIGDRGSGISMLVARQDDDDDHHHFD